MGHPQMPAQAMAEAASCSHRLSQVRLDHRGLPCYYVNSLQLLVLNLLSYNNLMIPAGAVPPVVSQLQQQYLDDRGRVVGSVPVMSWIAASCCIQCTGHTLSAGMQLHDATIGPCDMLPAVRIEHCCVLL